MEPEIAELAYLWLRRHDFLLFLLLKRNAAMRFKCHAIQAPFAGDWVKAASQELA